MLYLADRQKSKYSPKYPDFVLLVMDALKQILTMYVVHFLVLFSYLCFFGRHSRSNARGKYTFANAYGHSRWRLSWHSKCCAYLLRSWCVKLPLHYNCCRNRIYARYVLIAKFVRCKISPNAKTVGLSKYSTGQARKWQRFQDIWAITVWEISIPISLYGSSKFIAVGDKLTWSIFTPKNAGRIWE